jgi:hypothetical protein
MERASPKVAGNTARDEILFIRDVLFWELDLLPSSGE